MGCLVLYSLSYHTQWVMSEKPAKVKSVGGKFKFKKKASSSSVLSKASLSPGLVSLEDVSKLKGAAKVEVHLTEAQKKHKEKIKTKVEEREVKAVSNKSYRERIEEFNYKLSITTEHNDIPRISAAGNG